MHNKIALIFNYMYLHIELRRALVGEMINELCYSVLLFITLMLYSPTKVPLILYGWATFSLFLVLL